MLISAREDMTANHHAGVLVLVTGWWALLLSRSCHLSVSLRTVVGEIPRQGFLLVGRYDRSWAKDK